MKKQKLWIVTTLLTAGAVCLTGTLSAADAKAEPKKPAAAPAPKTGFVHFLHHLRRGHFRQGLFQCPEASAG